jgi:hypothetical protein
MSSDNSALRDMIQIWPVTPGKIAKVVITASLSKNRLHKLGQFNSGSD